MAYPATIYILLKGNIVCPVADVASEEIVTVTTFSGNIYRDTLDSSFLGRNVITDAHTQQVQLASSSDDPFTNTASGGAVFSGIQFVQTGSPGETTTTGVVTTVPESDPFALQSDEYTHTAPRFQSEKRDKLVYKNAAATVVGQFWYDQVRGVCTEVPTYPV